MNTRQTYLFYDIETTGLSKAFDQVLHFAAIRTDASLKELERYELKIKLNKDTIPSPIASITHQISLKELADGLPEVEAMQQIHQLFNQANTISLGYNTLRFDDEFLRFSFYRNLLPPYTHQYANLCGRMDMYPMAVMYFLFKNSIIRWPIINGKISLKLADLSAANQLAEGRAHHAMVDVEATLSLARHFFKERDMWNYLIGYFNKETDQARLENLKNTIVLLIEGILGAEQAFQCPVLFLGIHQHYKNQLIWLRLDSENLSQTTPDTIADTRVMHKKIGESGFILPLKDRFLQHLTPERKQLAEYNKKWLEKNPEIFSKLIAYHTDYQYPVYPETDIAARLYLNGFWNTAETRFCRDFHLAGPLQKAELTQHVKNVSLQELALRILGKHYPEVLTPHQKEQFSNYMKKINPATEQDALIDYQGKKRLTPSTALNEALILRKDPTLTNLQLELLRELEAFYTNCRGISIISA
jgi:exodeoxyribonuclease-1